MDYIRNLSLGFLSGGVRGCGSETGSDRAGAGGDSSALASRTRSFTTTMRTGARCRPAEEAAKQFRQMNRSHLDPSLAYGRRGGERAPPADLRRKEDFASAPWIGVTSGFRFWGSAPYECQRNAVMALRALRHYVRKQAREPPKCRSPPTMDTRKFSGLTTALPAFG
ncbi:hypothetical protein EVAR_46516_1 [Eumeta japonica]|uniref:Uncharacterized protein n=1 Tax=Eumeta variegata TaxID=151549 RepID=A0A4C1WTG6_EUMVA|nr:hypothetical protein EVAR_46516_1 [Eumeta japonica]